MYVLPIAFRGNSSPGNDDFEVVLNMELSRKK